MSESLTKTDQQHLFALLIMDPLGKDIAQSLPLDAWSADPAQLQLVKRIYEFREANESTPAEYILDFIAELNISSDKKEMLTKKVDKAVSLYDGDRITKDHVMGRLNNFYRATCLRRDIAELAGLIDAGDLEGADALLMKASSRRIDSLEQSARFTDHHLVLNRPKEDLENRMIRWGVGPLDRRKICPTKKKVMLIHAATGKGKTWALVTLGMQAILQKKNVLHVSCEMPREDVLERYYQNAFCMTTDTEPEQRVRYNIGEGYGLSRDLAFGEKSLKLDPGYAMDQLQPFLEADNSYGQLVILEYPPNTATAPMIQSKMRWFANTEGLVFDEVLVDYVSIMQIRKQELKRHEMGAHVIGLKKIATEEDVAMVAAIQSNREGIGNANVRAKNAGEDISMIQHSDFAISYSQTEDELSMGIGRLYVDKARGTRDNFEVMITQDYATGQFCKDAVEMDHRWRRSLDKAIEDRKEEEGGRDD